MRIVPDVVSPTPPPAYPAGVMSEHGKVQTEELADFRIPAAARVTSEQVWLSSASATSALKTAKLSAPRAGEQVGSSSHAFLSEKINY